MSSTSPTQAGASNQRPTSVDRSQLKSKIGTDPPTSDNIIYLRTVTRVECELCPDDKGKERHNTWITHQDKDFVEVLNNLARGWSFQCQQVSPS